MVVEDRLTLRILSYLADRYRPVTSELVDLAEIASVLGAPMPDIELRCRHLVEQTLVEIALPDAENENAAAVITVKGLLAIGRVP